MSSSLPAQRSLEDALSNTGNSLLMPPDHVDELLSLLDKAEFLLCKVWQSPSETMTTALVPMAEALIAPPLLKHPNEDVKVSVACCISQLTRVTAPDQTYDDADMKEVFELTVIALGKLSLGSGRSYLKAVSILHTLARSRSCVLMMDLECSDLIVDMIKIFVETARLNHSDFVFFDMETVMTIVINEIDEISSELLIPIIRSMITENQNDSPLRWKLGENVCKRCSPRIQAHLPRVAELMNEELNVIARMIFPARPGVFEREQRVVGEHVPESSDMLGNALSSKTLENDHNRNTDTDIEANLNSLDSVEASRQAKLESIPGKRKRKPNSLFKPEEGYYYPSLNEETEELHLYSATGSRNRENRQSGETSKGKHKKKRSAQKQQVSGKSINEELVGCLIQVWWPDDKEFYQGIVHSFDSTESKHLVKYDDGDVEFLDLSNEQWILLLGSVDQEGSKRSRANPEEVSAAEEGAIV